MDENKTVNQLQDQSLMELESLREDNNEENKKVVDDAKKKIEEIFAEFKEWAKDNTDPETVKENLNKAKEDVLDVLHSTKEKVIEISESQQFRATVEAGKEFLTGAGALVADGLKAGADLLMKNDQIKKIVDQADEKLDVLRESENLRNVVNTAEEVTEKVTDALFTGIKKFFDKNDTSNKEGN